MSMAKARKRSHGARVLVVEDDPHQSFLYKNTLTLEGFRVRVVATASEALLLAGASDLVILDVSLPDGTGWEVAERIREDHPEVAILFATGMGDHRALLQGFEVGADDYLVKPLNFEELCARARAILRRRKGPEPLRMGRLSVDLVNQTVWLDQRPLSLTVLEYDMLALFVQHPLRIWTRYELLSRVWGPDRCVTHRAVDVRIRYLRRAIDDDPHQPIYIDTVRGRGYRWLPAPARPMHKKAS